MSMLLLASLIAPDAMGQPLWSIKSTQSDYSIVDYDSSSGHLKTILNDATILGKRPFRWLSAAKLLAIHRAATDRSYLIGKLSLFSDRDPQTFRWSTYYYAQLIRGFLGDSAAIAGMDSVATQSDDVMNRVSAISLLAQRGHYDHFDVVRAGFGPSDRDKLGYYLNMGLYGKSAEHRQEAGNLLSSTVSDVSLTTEACQAARALSVFDSAKAIQLLSNRFQSAIGASRMMFFTELHVLDPNHEPDRIMLAVPLETDDHLRFSYFPQYQVISSEPSADIYLSPTFINFLIDRSMSDPSNPVRSVARQFLDEFYPHRPSSTSTTLANFDTLSAHWQRCVNLGWIGTSLFVVELESHLTSARASLLSGDSAGLARQVLLFRNKITEEYVDSLDGDLRKVTREGWKFMFYESQYILDRLSFVSTLDISQPADYSLVSVPLDLGYFLKTQVYPRSTSDAYLYDPKSGYVKKDTLANGIGYWLKYPTVDSAKYFGIKLQTVSAPVDTGWNVIGSLSEDIHKSRVSPQGVTVLSDYFGYQKGVGYYVVDTLKSGRGSWVKVAERGSLLLGGNTSGTGGSNEQPPAIVGAPDTPTLVSPAVGATGVALSPTLSWNSAARALDYQLQVASDSLFAGLIFNQSGLTATSRQVGPLQYSTSYHWRVNARNDTGTSLWSIIRKFTIMVPTTAPPTPTLIAPSNLATNVGVSPVVSWNASSTASSYRVQVSTVSSFAVLVQDHTGLQMTSKVLSTLANSTTYYWRVSATNAYGTSGWSSAWRFTTLAAGGGGCETYSSIQAMDQFTLSDSKGNSQKLYAHNKGRALALNVPDLSMPPEPPPGTYSVRFVSNKFIEGIQPNQPTARIPIKVRDAQFPVRLEWEVNPTNRITYWLVIPGKKEVRMPMTGNGSRSLGDPGTGVIIIEAVAVPPCEP
jgi:hypothetical protein